MLSFLSAAFSSLKTKMLYTMAVVDEIPFIPHHLSSSAFCKCLFSDAKFNLEVYKTGEKKQAAFYVKDLFHAEITETHRTALEFIYRSRSVLWDYPKQPKQKTLESNITLDLCSQILQHISKPNEIILETAAYKCLLEKTPLRGIRHGYTGIGSLETWHGSPDLLVRGTSFVVTSMGDVEDEDESDDEPESDGTSSMLEIKSVVRNSHLPQAISTCITFSFTEHNLHSQMNPAVPTILMDGTRFRVVLYDCIMDVLLISPFYDLCKAGRLSSTAVTFLWLVINHR